MSRLVRICCDRCGSPILERGSIVEVKASTLTRQLPEAIDLAVVPTVVSPGAIWGH
jgi:hypothetical protein